jgi:hypothetical protein
MRMFPISADYLPLREIADYWSREIKPAATLLELLRVLESAWWRGEIVGEVGVSRLALIKHLFQSSHDFGIVFVLGDESGLPSITEVPDGTVEVDIRPRIGVPSTDPVRWNDTDCAPAYESLAATPVLASDATIGPVLSGINLSYREFTHWLERRHYGRPTFWAPVETNDDTPRFLDHPRSDESTSSPTTRGRQPKKRLKVMEAMRRDLQQHRLSVTELEEMLEKMLADRYEVSRDTARKAREVVLSEYNSRQ